MRKRVIYTYIYCLGNNIYITQNKKKYIYIYLKEYIKVLVYIVCMLFYTYHVSIMGGQKHREKGAGQIQTVRREVEKRSLNTETQKVARHTERRQEEREKFGYR